MANTEQTALKPQHDASQPDPAAVDALAQPKAIEHKGPTPRRVSTVKLRLRPDEADKWRDQAKAEDLTLSNLIRKRMGDAKPTRVDPPKPKRMGRKADPALIAALGRVGNNLNQLAKWANTYKSDAETREVLALLVSIEQILLSYCPAPGRVAKGEKTDAVGDSDHVS